MKHKLSDVKVYVTTDYSIFKDLQGNRIISKKHVAEIVGSIEKKDLLRAEPAVVNKDLMIIDGQHRLRAAAFKKKPFYYIIEPDLALEDVQLLNAFTSKWVLRDYVESYILLGKEQYAKLKDFSTMYKVSLPISVMLLIGSDKFGRSALETVKDGNFKITAYEDAVDIADKLWDLRSYLEQGVYQDRDFVRAVRRIRNQVDWKLFVQQVRATKKKIDREGSMKHYIRVFEDIWSFKKHTITRFV